MELVTGRKGEAHVTSQQDRMLHQGVFGVEAYILNTGKKLRPEVQSSNEIRIRDGALMVQGALSCVKINTYDSITIQNGTQGMKRIDLVVWQYVYNAENDTEYSEWNVIQGTPDEIEPHMPEYVQGDIQSGDNFVQVPYLAVHLDGINITEVRTLLEVIPDIYTTNKNLTNSVDELNRNFKESVYADGYMVVDIGALPNNSTKSVPANIPSESEYWISDAWCKSRTTGQVSPMPYIDASTWSNAIGITISASKNIAVTTKADWSAYSGKAVIAYKL